MAKLTETTVGNVSGRVGDLVFVKYMDKVVIRTRPRRKKRNPSSEELLTRQKFSLANSLSSKFKPLFDSIKLKNSTLNPRKEFFSRSFLAISASPSGLALDYSKFEFSRGLHTPVYDLYAALVGSSIQISWNPDSLSSTSDDLFVMAFSADSDSLDRINPRIASSRFTAGNLILPIPSSWALKPIHLYWFRLSENGKASDTLYRSLFLKN